MDPVVAPADRAEDTQGAFEAFYRRSYPGAVRLCWLLTHDAGLAEELAQEAFTKLYPSYERVGNPNGYLRAVIVNGVRQRYRRSERDGRRLTLVTAVQPVHAVPSTTGELVDALHHLPDKQRIALVLRYWADLDEADIAAALDVRPATVRTLVARGLASLRKEIPE